MIIMTALKIKQLAQDLGLETADIVRVIPEMAEDAWTVVTQDKVLLVTIEENGRFGASVTKAMTADLWEALTR